MPSSLKLSRITVAVTHLPEMVAFYNAVFGADLNPIAHSPLYRGSMAGLELVFCPNDIAQVVARQNRKQLHFTVSDLDAIVKVVQEHQGTIRNQSEDEVGIIDPDGNTLVLKQG
jgi:predicted enzyme related to lactoylglutathione lyase